MSGSAAARNFPPGSKGTRHLAKLESFRIRSSAIANGEWQRVGEDGQFDDLDVFVKGFSNQYRDDLARTTKALAKRLRCDESKIPTDDREAAVKELVADLVLDVRNLTDGDGKPVAVEDFRLALQHPDYHDMYLAVVLAAAKVGRTVQEAKDEAVKN